ncbi:MAG: hypothetical protein ABI645_14310 [Pseudomonadota bacterium]
MQPENLYRIPFVVGITGHRDPLPSQVPAIHAALVSLLQRLKDAHPDVRIQVLCSMADGADLLIAEVALELGIEVLALLTFPEDVCRSDLLSDAARHAFDHVIQVAERLELPVSPALASELQQGSAMGPERDRQYQRAGLLLSRYCSLLIAIWDGKPTTHVAGSARVVEFRRHGSRQQGEGQLDVLLDSADNDLLFEIHCARASDPVAAAAQPPIAISGYSGEEVDATSGDVFEVPAVLRQQLTRTAEFNRDSVELRAGIAAHAWPLVPIEEKSARSQLAQLNQLFVQADYMGSLFRQRFLRGIRRRYLMWGGMATLLIAFEGTSLGIGGLLLVLSVLSVFLISLVHAGTAHRHSWHRKCLDYRALAETLRVDYFWEITGVRHRYAGEFAHESFLQKQDVDLAWIRAAMRAISLRLAMHPIAPSHEGLAEAMKEWIGDQNAQSRSGQVHYYNARSRQLRQRVHRDERLDQVPVVVGTTLSVIFLIDIVASMAGYQVLPQILRGVLLWTMALATAYGSIYEVYVTARGDRPLIRQYRHMFGLFGRASTLLKAARTDDERLAVLRSLGHACLAEHAQWTLAQRDKAIEGLKW